MKAFQNIENKIVDKSSATEIIEKWKTQGEKIVFTNGCFDLLHLGHLDYLAKAKDLGSKLVLGLNSSESVRRLKGPTRPINSDESRSKMLASLEFIDLVVLFSEDTPLDLITAVRPNVLVKGGDYTKETIVGAEEVESLGGSVQVIAFLPGFSTSSLVTKIQNLSTN